MLIVNRLLNKPLSNFFSRLSNPPVHRQPHGDSPPRRGAVIVAVLLITMATMLVGLTSLILSSTEMKITWNFKRSAMAFFAAEAGLERAVQELRNDNSWTTGFDETDLSNDASYQVTLESVSGQLSRIISTGAAGASRRLIEAVINIDSAFDHALNIGGDLLLSGRPRISAEGIRVNGDVFLDLDSGTPSLNIFAPADSVITFSEGSEIDPVNLFEKAPLDLNAARLSDEDWSNLADLADPTYTYDNDGIPGNNDTTLTINNLDFADVPPDADGKRTIYVDGDITLNGTIAGIGTIIATGKIIGTGGFVTIGIPTISFISRDDVMLNFGTNAQSLLNGLTYAEGDYELHGKIKYTGVVTTFGTATIQNPSEFANNSDPNFWYTYSSAYSIVSDPIDILLWHEITE